MEYKFYLTGISSSNKKIFSIDQMFVFVETTFFHVLFFILFSVSITPSSTSKSLLLSLFRFTLYFFLYFPSQQQYPNTAPIIVSTISPAAINPTITQTFPKIKLYDSGYSHAPTISLYIFPFLHSQLPPSAGSKPSLICEQFSWQVYWEEFQLYPCLH